MSVCSSSSPTYLQDFEHIMNLGETQMTPCPLIPFIPQSKRTRTLYLCLYLCTKTNTHTPLCCFLHHPPSDPRDVGSSEWVSASRVCRLRSWWTLLQPNLSFQDHSIKPTCIYILNRWRMVLMCGKLYLLPTVSTLSLMFWVLSRPLCLEFSHFWPAWCSWNIGFLMFDFSNDFRKGKCSTSLSHLKALNIRGELVPNSLIYEKLIISFYQCWFVSFVQQSGVVARFSHRRAFFLTENETVV